MPIATPSIRIDWDADGAVDADASLITTMLAAPAAATLEDVTLRVRRRPGVVIQFGRDRARELAPPLVGKAQLELMNEDGVFSSQNTASPLYPNVRSGRLLVARAAYGGTTYGLRRAYLEEPREKPLQGDQAVSILALDGLGRLNAVKISTPEYTNAAIHTLIGIVLDAVGWSATARIIDTFKTTVARWCVHGITAFRALRELVLTEGGSANFYVDGDGNLVAEGRHFRFLTSRSINVQATFRDQGAEPLMTRFAFVPGESGIVNSCEIPVRSYSEAALASIWTGPTPLALAPGETWVRTVSTTASWFKEAVVPNVADGDYALSGTAPSSITLSRLSGKTAVLTIVQPSSGGCTITGLRVRAKAVSFTEQLVGNSIDTSASQLRHGPKSLEDDFIPVWVPTVSDAVDWCNATVIRYQDEVPQAVVGVNNATDERLTQALVRRPSDRIHVSDTSKAHSSRFDANCFIEAVEHRFTPDGTEWETLWTVERAADSAFWVLGDATFGVLGTTTRMGF